VYRERQYRPAFRLVARFHSIGDSRSVRFVPAAVVLCCSLSAAGGAARSGSRITVRHEVANNGQAWREYQRLHDELLGVDCSLLRASDGVLRCLPGSSPPSWWSREYYADESCTVPVLRVAGSKFDGPCEEYSYVAHSIPGADGRPDGAGVSKALEELAPDSPVFQMKSGKCVSTKQYLGRYFRAGPVLDPSGFVAFTSRQIRLPAAAADAPPDAGASGTRISVLRDELVGSDGTIASPSEHLRDENFQVSCSIKLGNDDVWRCLPDAPKRENDLSSVNLFADAYCQKPVTRVDPLERAHLSQMVAWSRGTRFFWVLGEHPADQPVFKIADGRCIETTQSLAPLVVFGPEIPLVDFVAFTRRELPTRRAPGNALLVPRDPSRIAVASWQFVGEDGSAPGATVASYQDEKLGTKCEMKMAADGVVRCLPAILYRIFYADDRCTVPIGRSDAAGPSIRWFPARLVNPYNPLRPEFLPPPKRKSHPDNRCIYKLEVFALGPERPAPDATFVPGLLEIGCQWVPMDRPGRYYSVGPEIPPRDFVAFRESRPRRRHVRGSRKR